jgi:Fe-S-cluster containining protein
VSGGGGESVRDHGYADLTVDDVGQLSRHVQGQLHQILFDDAPTIYRTKAKQLPSGKYACRYLRGTPGQRCSCTIYDTRPEICQNFRVGGVTCQAARIAAGFDQAEGHE